MAQDPAKFDQLQIEPGAVGTRLINRATDGSLRFTDPSAGALTLSQLAGLRNIAGVLIVGKSGSGAAYTTVQAALDAIPATSDPVTDPYIVLIGPGRYAETLNIVRNGVSLVGLGGVILDPLQTTPNGVGAYHTVVVQAALGTIPRSVALHNLTIRNFHDNYACVRVSGGAGSGVGSLGVVLYNCVLSPEAPGGNRGVWATAVNRVSALWCSEASSTGLALDLIENVADFGAKGSILTACEFTYDTADPQPSLVPTGYRLLDTQLLGSTLNPALRVSLTGDSEFAASGVLCDGNVDVAGDRAAVFSQCQITDLTIGDSAQVVLLDSSRGTLAAAGTATLAEPRVSGAVAFAAEATKDVVFDAPGPDDAYAVAVEADDDLGGSWWVTNKTAAGFRINVPAPVTLDVIWVATR